MLNKKNKHTYCTFPTISNNFSWITFTTSKLQRKRERRIKMGISEILQVINRIKFTK